MNDSLSVPTQLIRIEEVAYSKAVDHWIHRTAQVFIINPDGNHRSCNGRDFKEMIDHFDNGGKFGIKDLTPELKAYYENTDSFNMG